MQGWGTGFVRGPRDRFLPREGFSCQRSEAAHGQVFGVVQTFPPQSPICASTLSALPQVLLALLFGLIHPRCFCCYTNCSGSIIHCAVMKQGEGRKPGCAASPGPWPAPQRVRSRARGMLLVSTFTMTPTKIFSSFGSSALHFWLCFLPLSPVLCIRCCSLELRASLVLCCHFLNPEVLITNSVSQSEVSDLVDLGTVCAHAKNRNCKIFSFCFGKDLLWKG